jgi:hypothetical protein
MIFHLAASHHLIISSLLIRLQMCLTDRQAPAGQVADIRRRLQRASGRQVPRRTPRALARARARVTLVHVSAGQSRAVAAAAIARAAAPRDADGGRHAAGGAHLAQGRGYFAAGTARACAEGRSDRMAVRESPTSHQTWRFFVEQYHMLLPLPHTSPFFRVECLEAIC